jgi:hypothetical protein
MIVEVRWAADLYEFKRATFSNDKAEQARSRLVEHRTYAHYLQHVTCHYELGVLILRGRVPTDRLRDALVRLVSDLAEIDSIDNQVDVISSTGLSWVRPR